MKIGVVGGGCVGKATARCFIEHVDEVRVYDVVKELATHSLDSVLACDLIFVCLPTPQYASSLECDTSAVETFFQSVAGSPANFVLRSTVPVGFTRSMRERYRLTNLVHSPEFLTARVAITDAQLPARNIVGAPHLDPLQALSDAARSLGKLYRHRFPGVPCVVCDSDESELIKLGTNGFFATKIAYFNELRTLADAMKVNWSVVLAGILADGRISHSHTSVPGPDGQRGYGGACLPKDIANLITCMREAELVPHVTSAAYARNLKDRR